MKAILLDIEGTTTPIDFVHKTLFPFAKKHIGTFVANHFDHLREEINQLVDEQSKDATYTVPPDPTEPGSVSAYLEHLIDVDRKSTPLKSIQGKIWQQGYESGELKSVIFDDVPPAFQKWKDEGKRIAIYSSGSVLAQELIFKHSDHGDLTPFIDSYFDTNVGHKREANSYRQIALELKVEGGSLLFVSDITAELDAANDAGLKTALSIRDGSTPDAGVIEHRVVTSFRELN